MKDSIYDDLGRVYGNREPTLKLLYTTPETLIKSERMKTMLGEMYGRDMIARFVIDEAHCVSSWGHDFRKEYGNLGIMKERYPEVKILALTATARQKVADDVCKVLDIRDSLRISCGYDRPNLLFEVRPKPRSHKETLEKLLDYILSYCNSTTGTTGIVYCMTKKECEQTADFLQENNLRADYYHAGQSTKDRDMIQAAWLRGDIDIVCATIAYGMGIDKPDVRYVVHTSLAKSIEGYYQEAGRAGRDGGQSECILFYKPSDVDSLMRLMSLGKPRLAAREVDRLEEMKIYCEEEMDCRRKIFSNAFGNVAESVSSTSSSPSLTKKGKEHMKHKTSLNTVQPSSSSSSSVKFVPCGSMCDNCQARSGVPRRGRDDDDVNDDDNKRKEGSKKRGAKATFQTAKQMKNGTATKSKRKPPSLKRDNAPIDLTSADDEVIIEFGDDLEDDGLRFVNDEIEEAETIENEWSDSSEYEFEYE